MVPVRPDVTSGNRSPVSHPLPRCIVEVRWGKHAGTKVAIEPGRTLRVGRTDRADLVLSHDGKLSSVHFELSWDGERCTLRDADSLSGTSLGGAPVTQAQVPHGGWIQAGDTDFMVYFEGHTPPRDTGEDEDNASEYTQIDAPRLAAAQAALQTLRAHAATGPLYAVLDAARDERILELLREHVEPHRSLYEGAEGEALDEVAPYLAGPMAPDSTLLEKLVLEGWGKRWGIYCTSAEPFREVRRHLRRFLMVTLEETGERVYFRFVDPDVLVPFMEVATSEQKASLTTLLSGLAAEHHGRSLGVWHVHP